MLFMPHCFVIVAEILLHNPNPKTLILVARQVTWPKGRVILQAQGGWEVTGHSHHLKGNVIGDMNKKFR